MPEKLGPLVAALPGQLVSTGIAGLRRGLYRRTRPDSKPYISGDGFRRIANHRFDETRFVMEPDKWRSGNVAFAATHLAERFLRECAPRIEVPYTLITHNSDASVDEGLARLLDSRIQRWFAQNATVSDERIIPIPIGLENLHHYHAGVPSRISFHARHATRSRNRILSAFNVGTNAAVRSKLRAVALDAPQVDCLPTMLDQEEYLETLGTYRFVLSPPGNGPDTHRTWEALYLGIIPIVVDSVAMRFFERLGLPIWILQDWRDLVHVREQELKERYEQWKHRLSSPALSMDFWTRWIREGSPPPLPPMSTRPLGDGTGLPPPARSDETR